MNIRQLLERSDRPFASHPQVGQFYASASIEDARRRLGRTIERGDGLGVAIGPAGTGKSLLLQVLAAQHHDQFDVVLLACAQLCTRRALLQAILFELGQEYRLRDEGELRLSLLDQLLADERDSAGLLLLVDEAQLLPSRLLEELRMLTNIVQGGVPRVRLVLAGMPALEEVLAGPELESFSQRVVARCYLGPFSREETIQYGRSQIAAVGGDADRLFTTDAWHAVFEATDGVPRLVNQLCSRAMWLADAQQSVPIDRSVIQAAWSDLQQLPTPWTEEPRPSVPSANEEVVEFGGLEDEPANQESGDFETPKEEDEQSWEEVTAGTDWNSKSDSSHAGTPKTENLEAFSWPSHADAVGAESEARQSNWEASAPAIASSTPESSERSSHDDEACETVDPFGESYEHEEVVLDHFSSWDSTHYKQFPRVENRRERGFATLVQQALDASAAEGREPKQTPAPPKPAAGDAQGPQVEESTSARSRVRLAVVSEPAPLRPIPVVKASESHEDPRGEVGESETVDRPTEDPAASDDMDILIVENDLEELSNVEDFGDSDRFRQLLARLRGDS